jgi:hypothetical protein
MPPSIVGKVTLKIKIGIVFLKVTRRCLFKYHLNKIKAPFYVIKIQIQIDLKIQKDYPQKR